MVSVVGLLASFVSLVLAQEKVKVEFDDRRERQFWIGRGFPRAPGNATETVSQSTELAYAKRSDLDRLFVHDLQTGNLAIVPLAGVRDRVRVPQARFQWVYQVIVKVEHAGKPVSTARISIRDRQRSQAQLLGPTQKGAVSAFTIAPGPVRIEVEYQSDGVTKKTPTLVYELKLKRDLPTPVITIPISDPVETVAAAPAQPAQDKATSKTSSPGSVIGTVVLGLIGLAAVAGIAFGLLRIAQKNPTAIEDKLKSLGVQIPDPNAAPDPGPDGVVPAKPEPQKPIVLDDAAPIPLGTAAPVGGSAAITGQPRLVGPSGAIAIPDGLSVVGREEGLPVSLPDQTTVSRRHAEFRREGDSVIVADLGSTNGTFVNGVRVEGESSLKPGDAVQFGEARFRYEA